MKQNKKRKGVSRNVQYCPYCGSRTEFRSADGIYHDNPDNTMLYVCKNYPNCDTYVRVYPGTTVPMGTMANGHLRALRTQAHRYFNQLYTKGIMSRKSPQNGCGKIKIVDYSDFYKLNNSRLPYAGKSAIIEEISFRLPSYEKENTNG